LVEYQVNLHTGRSTDDQLKRREDEEEEGGEANRDDNEDDDDDELEGLYGRGKNAGVSWEYSTTSSRSPRGSRAMIFGRGELLQVQ